MKKVYIIHGWDGNPDEPVFVWLAEELAKQGISVERPAMPDPETPVIEAWVSALQKTIIPTQETVLFGHSVGCQAVMRYAETLSEDTRIAGMVLLAPWMKLDQTTIEEEGEEVVEIARPWMETPINFEKVKKIAERVIAIFSDNDPFVPLHQKEFFEDVLQAKTIVEHDFGHFAPDDRVREVPSVLKSILSL